MKITENAEGDLMHDELYVVLSPKEEISKTLIGARGPVDWTYPVTDLLASTWYKVRLSFKAEEVMENMQLIN